MHLPAAAVHPWERPSSPELGALRAPRDQSSPGSPAAWLPRSLTLVNVPNRKELTPRCVDFALLRSTSCQEVASRLDVRSWSLYPFSPAAVPFGSLTMISLRDIRFALRSLAR